MRKGFVFAFIVFSFLIGFVLIAESYNARLAQTEYYAGEKVAYLFDSAESNIASLLGVVIYLGEKDVTVEDELARGGVDLGGIDVYRQHSSQEAMVENVNLTFEGDIDHWFTIEPYGIEYRWDSFSKNRLTVKGSDDVVTYTLNISIDEEVNYTDWDPATGGWQWLNWQCSNGYDDDGDGLVDCEDPDCSIAPYCYGRDMEVIVYVNDGSGDVFELQDFVYRGELSTYTVSLMGGDEFYIDFGDVGGTDSSIFVNPQGIGMDIITTIEFYDPYDIEVQGAGLTISATDLTTGLKRIDSVSLLSGA